MDDIARRSGGALGRERSLRRVGLLGDDLNRGAGERERFHDDELALQLAGDALLGMSSGGASSAAQPRMQSSLPSE
jgi:hypothetical protein